MFGIGEAARRARAARALPKRPSAAVALSAAIAASMALAASCRTVPTPRIGDAGRRPAAGSAAVSATGGPLPVEAYVPGPIVRVGIIVDVTRAVVSLPPTVPMIPVNCMSTFSMSSPLRRFPRFEASESGSR